MRKISLADQTWALRGGNPCNRIGTLSGGNPTTEGFDSRKLIEKEPIGKAALPSPSGKNPIMRADMHSPPSGENSISGRTDFEWENPNNGVILSEENSNSKTPGQS